MPLSGWKKIRREFELRNPWWSYRKDSVRLPTGKEGEYHYVHVLGSSLIVPFLDDGRVVMVRQYRYLADRESLEFPCGSVKEGSDYKQTALYELSEETGYTCGNILPIGEFNPYNGVTDEMCTVFVARNLAPLFRAPDETEEFEIESLTVTSVEEKIKSGEIWDGMTLAAWMVAKLQLQEASP